MNQAYNATQQLHDINHSSYRTSLLDCSPSSYIQQVMDISGTDKHLNTDELQAATAPNDMSLPDKGSCCWQPPCVIAAITEPGCHCSLSTIMVMSQLLTQYKTGWLLRPHSSRCTSKCTIAYMHGTVLCHDVIIVQWFTVGASQKHICSCLLWSVICDLSQVTWQYMAWPCGPTWSHRRAQHCGNLW